MSCLEQLDMWDAIIKITKLFTTWKTSQPAYPEQQEDHQEQRLSGDSPHSP